MLSCNVIVRQVNCVFERRCARGQKCIPSERTSWRFEILSGGHFRAGYTRPTNDILLVRKGSQKAAKDRHIHGGTNTLVANIRHDESDLPAGGDGKHIIEVTADLTC